jgi:hypothetical protein
VHATPLRVLRDVVISLSVFACTQTTPTIITHFAAYASAAAFGNILASRPQTYDSLSSKKGNQIMLSLRVSFRRAQATLLSRPSKTIAAIALSMVASAGVQASATKPDALLQVDLNRVAIVERIVSQWERDIPAGKSDAFKSVLMRLRADQLLAANLSGSFDAVLELLDSQSLGFRAQPAAPGQLSPHIAERAKAAGEPQQDVVYTPITPCRFLDTRGAFSPVFSGGAFSSGQTRTYQVTGNCGVPIGAAAVVLQIIMITPTAAGDIEVLPQGATFGGTVAMVFQANTFSSVSLNARLNQSNGQLSTQIRGPGGNVAMDIVGYFIAPTRSGDGLRIVRSTPSGGSPDPVPNVINGDDSNDIGNLTNTIAGTTISGGADNFVGAFDGFSGSYTTIGGGRSNQAGYNTPGATGGDYATVSGGQLNIARDFASAVGGGEQNYALGTRSTISGGASNQAEGGWATVPGGESNQADGNYSYAAGRSAKAFSAGQFVWADSTFAPFDPVARGLFTSGENTFSVRAGGGISMAPGVNINTGAITNNCKLTPTSTNWSCTSDRNLKENVVAISARQVLERLVTVPISKWSMIGSKERQMGPMAQDFYRAFALGAGDKTINTTDAQGVAFAAIQGLNEKLVAQGREKDRKISALEKKAAELDALKAELAAIKKKLGL